MALRYRCVFFWRDLYAFIGADFTPDGAASLTRPFFSVSRFGEKRDFLLSLRSAIRDVERFWVSLLLVSFQL